MEFSNRTVGLILLAQVILLCLISTTSAYDFDVGGKEGWVRNPSQSFNKWSAKSRFQVHDRLVFKYSEGEDSVVEVSKEGYDSCNASLAIKKVGSTFELDRSGPFYFIGGSSGSCAMGQKLKVVVISARRKPLPPTPPPNSSQSPSPMPSSYPPSPSPSSLSPLPYSHSPPSLSPSPSPSPSPSSSSESPSPSPSSGSPSPSSTPSYSPNGYSQTPSPPPNNSPHTPSPSPDSPSQESSAFFAVPSLSVGMLVLVLVTAALIN